MLKTIKWIMLEMVGTTIKNVNVLTLGDIFGVKR